MSAPSTDLPSSVSSSGHIDGLGRRVLAFDRETGAILERLHLRPELAAFEAAIRRRVEQLASFDDERFARPGSVERDAASGDLTVLSEFVAGSRLSDLLETAEEAGLVPGVDVALGFLLEALPAISSFHTATGGGHGLIDSNRLVVTPAGQIIFLDAAFGPVIERLGLTAARLWREFGIASAPGTGPIRLDVTADIGQIVLGAMTLVIGRRLRLEEYPDALPSLLAELVEVAHIRGSHIFANSLERLFQRALPVPGRRAYASAEDLANEIRLLLRREIGTEVCRQALIDFTEQMDAQFTSARAASQDSAGPAAVPQRAADVRLDLDQLALDAIDSIEILDDEADRGAAYSTASEEPVAVGSDGFEEISLDPLIVDQPVGPAPPLPATAEDDPVLPLPDLADFSEETPITLGDAFYSPGTSSHAAGQSEVAGPWRFDSLRADRLTAEPNAVHASGPDSARPAAADADHAASPSQAVSPIQAAGSELARAAPPPAMSSVESAALATSAAGAAPADTAPPPEAEKPQEKPGWRLSRRLKRRQKSARARKDKLRSAAEPDPPQVASQTPVKPQQAGWLVSPEHAAAFEPAVPDARPPLPPAVIGQPAPSQIPVQPIAVSTPAMPLVVPPAPGTPAIRMPVYGAPASPPAPVAPPVPAPAPIQLQPMAVAPPAAPKPPAAAGAPLRLKPDPPPGYVPPRTSRSMSALPYGNRRPMLEAQPPREFPWKLAMAALLIVGLAVVIGRAYMPSWTSVPAESEAEDTETPLAEPAPAAAAAAVQTGEIVIATQPAGARVLLDGKAAGQSPLKLAKVPAGRHVLTFVSSAGAVTRTVRVAAGKSVSVDISIFSGWVAIFAPIVLEVSVNGRSMGTTEQERLMLPPGRHELTLSNRELGYSVVKAVDVEPGEVRSLTLDPQGEVNFNAIPWAQVWMDGKKLGDTPLANMRVPLGMREFVFRHPEYGERRVTVSIRADQPSAIGVDFTRLQ